MPRTLFSHLTKFCRQRDYINHRKIKCYNFLEVLDTQKQVLFLSRQSLVILVTTTAKRAKEQSAARAGGEDNCFIKNV